MDSRTLSWTHLLPNDAPIVPWRAPDDLLAALGSRASSAGDVGLLWEPTPHEVAARNHFRALALVNPREFDHAQLASHGFTNIRAFAVVPSLDDARWFIPLESLRAATAAWDLYTPFRRSAQIKKLVTRALTRCGRVVGDRIIVAQRETSLIERIVMQATRTNGVSIAIASGTPGPARKETLQIASPDGRVLAYAKVATRPETATLVRQEARFLDYVRSLDLQTMVTPTPLYHGAFGGGYLLVAEALPRQLSPSSTVFGAPHMDVLHELARHVGSDSMLMRLHQVRERIASLRETMDEQWHARLNHAITWLLAQNDLHALPTVVAHGDFAPWNVRINWRTRQVAVFDWEQGQREQFLLWDAFHFFTMVNILVHRQPLVAVMEAMLARMTRSPLARAYHLVDTQVRALFVAYLVDMCVHWFEERRSSRQLVSVDEIAQVMRGQAIDWEQERVVGYAA